jgi:hypothetical protein
VSVGGVAESTGEDVPDGVVAVISFPRRGPTACTMLALLLVRIGTAACATTSASPVASTISAITPRYAIATRSRPLLLVLPHIRPYPPARLDRSLSQAAVRRITVRASIAGVYSSRRGNRLSMVLTTGFNPGYHKPRLSGHRDKLVGDVNECVFGRGPRWLNSPGYFATTRHILPLAIILLLWCILSQ